MASELKNKLKLNGEEFYFATDTAPAESSDSFITSGAVYELLRDLSNFLGKKITNTISQYNQNIPTAGVVYDSITSATNGKAEKNTNTGHLSTALRHNVISAELTSAPASYSSYVGQTILIRSGGTVTVKYVVSATKQYTETPQSGLLYYLADSGKLCTWNGSDFDEITLTASDS